MVNKDSHYGTPYSYNCLKLLSQNRALVTWEIHQVLELWLPGRYTKCWSSGYLGDTPSVGSADNNRL